MSLRGRSHCRSATAHTRRHHLRRGLCGPDGGAGWSRGRGQAEYSSVVQTRFVLLPGRRPPSPPLHCTVFLNSAGVGGRILTQQARTMILHPAAWVRRPCRQQLHPRLKRRQCPAQYPVVFRVLTHSSFLQPHSRPTARSSTRTSDLKCP